MMTSTGNTIRGYDFASQYPTTMPMSVQGRKYFVNDIEVREVTVECQADADFHTITLELMNGQRIAVPTTSFEQKFTHDRDEIHFTIDHFNTKMIEKYSDYQPTKKKTLKEMMGD